MSFATLKPSLLSAQKLEQDYLAKRQLVALARLKEIQTDTARLMVKNILNKVLQECTEVDGFLSEAIIEILMKLRSQI